MNKVSICPVGILANGHCKLANMLESVQEKHFKLNITVKRALGFALKQHNRCRSYE